MEERLVGRNLGGLWDTFVQRGEGGVREPSNVRATGTRSLGGKGKFILNSPILSNAGIPEQRMRRFVSGI